MLSVCYDYILYILLCFTRNVFHCLHSNEVKKLYTLFKNVDNSYFQNFNVSLLKPKKGKKIKNVQHCFVRVRLTAEKNRLQ